MALFFFDLLLRAMMVACVKPGVCAGEKFVQWSMRSSECEQTAEAPELSNVGLESSINAFYTVCEGVMPQPLYLGNTNMLEEAKILIMRNLFRPKNAAASPPTSVCLPAGNYAGRQMLYETAVAAAVHVCLCVRLMRSQCIPGFG